MFKVILMVGIAASGKTTYAQSLFDSIKGDKMMFSSDELRAELGTGEDDQNVSRQVFEEIFERMDKAYTQGAETIIVDAMNLTPKSRKRFVQFAQQRHGTVEMYCMLTSLETCLERNSRRERQVPEEVIRSQSRRIQYPVVGNGEADYVYYIKPGTRQAPARVVHF